MTIAPTASAPGKEFGPTSALRRVSLRWRLMLLIAVGVVPLLLFNVGYQYFQYRADVATTGSRTLALAHTMSQLIEEELQARILVMQSLASAEAVRDWDVEDLRRRAQAVVDQQFPEANIVLVRPDGQVLMNLRIPPDAPLPVRPALDSIRQVLATGNPAVSNLFTGARTGRPVIAIDVPVKGNDGSIRYILSMNPRLDAFDDVIRNQHFPADWVVSIFDRKGINVARYPNSVKFIGHPASASLLGTLQSQDEGIIETTSLENIRLLSAFSHGERFGWSVAIGVPRAEVVGPVITGALKTLLAGFAVLVIGLLLALYVAKGITAPVARNGEDGPPQ